MKIRTRILIAFSLLIGVGVYFLVDRIYEDLRTRYLEAMEESMVDMATVLSSFLERSVTNNDIEPQFFRDTFDKANKKRFLAKIYALKKSKLEMRVYVTDKKGMVIFDSIDPENVGKDYSKWNDVYRTLKGEYGARSTRTDPDDPTTSILYVASPIKLNEEIIGVLTVSKPAKSVKVFLDQARRNFVISGIFTIITVLIAAWLLSLWITQPVKRLIAYIEKVRDGRRASYPDLGNSEIGNLGRSFEEMREALDGKNYVENYIQTLTHEMKSPLSALKGAAELLSEDMEVKERKRFTENIMIETDRLQNMVDRLLQLVSLENRNQLDNLEQLKIDDVVEDVLTSYSSIIFSKEIEIVKKIDDSFIFQGEYFLVRQAFANLMQNALRFSPQKGKIIVSLKDKDGFIHLSVEDEGSGVPDFARDKIFTRFFSLPCPDTGKKGTGLGLAFVKEVALLHGGDVIFDSTDNKTIFTITFPLNA